MTLLDRCGRNSAGTMTLLDRCGRNSSGTMTLLDRVLQQQRGHHDPAGSGAVILGE
jgi:hypothetical protein